MLAISATSYATPSAQAWQGRARLEQARREAEQAETKAKALRTEADQAEQDAQSGQARVLRLSAQTAQAQHVTNLDHVAPIADSTYSTALRAKGVASSRLLNYKFFA